MDFDVVTSVLIVGIGLVAFILFKLTSLRKKQDGVGALVEGDVRAEAEAPAGVGRRRRDARARLQAGAVAGRQNIGRNDDSDDADVEGNEDVHQFLDEEIQKAKAKDANAKIGTKKLRKLEMKAEKKAYRQAEEQDREEKKKRQAELDSQRQQQEHLDKESERLQEEQERQRREEEEKKAHEEYLRMKESFTVEEEGCSQQTEHESQTLLQEFIEFIKCSKVVLMEDLAAQFGLRTQDVILRVKQLLEQDLISGVIDDRGKFIFISQPELDSIAKFIKQRGRVSIAELAECSNSLITLTPTVS